MRFNIWTAASLVVTPSFVLAFVPSAKPRASQSALFGYVDVSESASRNMEPFDAWLSQCGVQRMDGVQLTTDDGLDYSLATSTDIPSGQPFLAVPAEMILRSSTAKQELLAMSPNGGVKEAVDQMGRIGAGLSVPEFYLTVKLLVEYEKGEQSPYFPCLDSLPRLFFNSVSMTDFCLECLPPLVFSLSRAERLKFDNFMTVLQKVDVISDQIKEEKEICKWAFNVVHTRCRGEEGEDQVIVPFGDMFNHGTETQVDFAFDEQGNFQAYTTTDVPAGSPLRVSYGCPTNPSNFFARYGFLDESSPATFCKMMNIAKTPETINLGNDPSKMLFYKDTGDVSQEVWDVVLYSKVLADNLGVKNQFYEAHMRGDEQTKAAIHQEYYLSTLKEVQQHVNIFLKLLDELSSKAEGKNVNEHPRLPLIMKHNEFVYQTFMNVKSKLDPMVAQAENQRVYA